MIKELNLSGLIGKRVALHNGEDWKEPEYMCVGYDLEDFKNTGLIEDQRIHVYLLCQTAKNSVVPIKRLLEEVKFIY